MQGTATDRPPNERLDSWKDIATYLQRDVRTVQLWEKNEGLPVHRHAHLKRGTVYAYGTEIDGWAKSRSGIAQPPNPPSKQRLPWFVIAAVVAVPLALAGVVWLTNERNSIAGAPESTILPLTSDPGSEMGASFSPDGTQVAFAWMREGRPDFDIYVKVVGSHEMRRLTNTADWDTSPAWSPDGRQIAFHRRGMGPEGQCGIYAVSPLGGPAGPVTQLSDSLQTLGCEHCECSPPNRKLSSIQFSWSPDGKWLARTGIFLLGVATGENRRLTSPPDQQVDAHPAFSPDGKSLAFVRAQTYSSHNLYVVAADGGEPRRLPTQGQMIFGLAWTPDGREIVYSSGTWEFGDATVWRVPVNGGSSRPVNEVRERAWLPSISVAGRRLAFAGRANHFVFAIGRKRYGYYGCREFPVILTSSKIAPVRVRTVSWYENPRNATDQNRSVRGLEPSRNR
jgi:dipeptidyl aminopeptidase/acylaminoacyl peptidase